jgi:Holliday junction resolvase RusA-like endonuclease
MHSFILRQKPNSYNSNTGNKKVNYTTKIQNAFRQFYPTHTTLTNELYGTLYYFYKRDINIDADNLSKPVWDGLTKFLYADDSQIKLRIAGCFDISKNDFNVLDTSGLSGDMLTELLDAFDTEEHILYIECGDFHHSLLKFNLFK